MNVVPRRSDTRERLLDAATALLWEQGFAATGVQAITSAAGVPKGSFYYFFPSKEALALAVVRRYATAVTQELDAALGDASVTPFARLGAFFAGWADRLAAGGCRRGCLVGNLAQELADTNEPFREELASVLDGWSARIAVCLTEAQRVETPEDARTLAAFLVASWQGAMLRMKLSRSPEPLRGFLAVLF